MAKVQSIIGSYFPKYASTFIEQAARSIDIVVFDWRWYANNVGASVQKFSQSIIRAGRRGVCVRVVGNNRDTLAILKEQGIKVKQLETKRLVHVKLMIIDGKHVIIGSHNYTQNAFTMNFEASVHIEDEEYAKEMEIYFQTLWQ